MNALRPAVVSRIPGISALTSSALVASIGETRSVCHGRQLAAWMVWSQTHSSWGAVGNPNCTARLSKSGDSICATLMIHCALIGHPSRTGKTRICRIVSGDYWHGGRNEHRRVFPRYPYARVVWALLAHDRNTEPHTLRPILLLTKLTRGDRFTIGIANQKDGKPGNGPGSGGNRLVPLGASSSINRSFPDRRFQQGRNLGFP